MRESKSVPSHPARVRVSARDDMPDLRFADFARTAAAPGLRTTPRARLSLPNASASSTRESGQAAVESALMLPLVIFLILGTLQLFLMSHGRLMAELAASRAVRVGSVQHGDCLKMTHAAIASVLPTFTTFLGNRTAGGNAAQKYAEAFRLRTQNKPFENQFDPVADDGHDRPVVWLFRNQPRREAVLSAANGGPEESFDDPNFIDPFRPPDAPGFTVPGYRLELRLVFWFPLRIPFANYVMATMFRAHYGIADFNAANPFFFADNNANWTAAPGAQLDAAVRNEFAARYTAGQYAFPIQATSGLRMFTPPRAAFFANQNCAPAP